ncbi:universal stress protein [Halostagnicola bangensis]
MKTILLCIDTSVERTKTQVASITRQPFEESQTTVHIYHVFRSDGEDADVESLSSVKKATELLEEEGFTVEVSQSGGDPARDIIEKAETLEAESISLVSRKRTPTGKALFGSVTQQVILESDTPVLVCTPK